MNTLTDWPDPPELRCAGYKACPGKLGDSGKLPILSASQPDRGLVPPSDRLFADCNKIPIIRFPVLVDEILDSDTPPVIDRLDPNFGPKWWRRDVQQVLTRSGGQLIDITKLAAYYGRFCSPAVTR